MQPEAATVIRKKLIDRRQNTGCAIASARVAPTAGPVDFTCFTAPSSGRSRNRKNAFGTVTTRISKPINA